MADVKHILVVDDHFEMLEFLRSMLQLSSQDYEVLAVPSAEEGLLELRRGMFDLLITDVRLPGMSGFDLIRRARRLGLNLPVIMITAYATAQGRKEAADLGVFQYFQKPLDTDDVLTAVNKALHGDEPAPPIAIATAVTPFTMTEDLRKRLETLRVDTGALQLVLSAIHGQVLHSVGSGPRIDQEKLAAIIARNVSDSFLLAREIGSKEPFTLQYHAGSRLELYCANIGEQHFLTLFFDAAARRGRIGTIWVFTQRAIKDLQVLLPATAVHAPLKQTPLPRAVEKQRPAVTPQPVVEPPTQPMSLPLPKVDEPEELELAPAENLPVNITIIGAEAEPGAPVDEPVAALDMGADELAALLAGGAVDVGADVDAFWDDVLDFSETEDDDQNKGLSVEEAIQKGLISGDVPGVSR
ncbi:MAG: response regulator [Chloroflexi bacterium]|nr:response regulator [Ardenticatenaceae bacterium]MBL1129356.1 response regulator [Chloroflexota bacterium]NOG35435.1 response regulator [Chloroflexota bacterium]